MNGPIILHQLVHPSLLIGGGGGGVGGGLLIVTVLCGGRREPEMALERAFTLKSNFHRYLGTANCSPHGDLVLLISMECPLNYVIAVITE